MLIAQINDFGDFLDKFQSEELIGLFAIATVFTTMLLIVVVACITHTIKSIRVASIRARTVETLARAGHSADEIERIVSSDSSRTAWPSRWQRATPPQLSAKPNGPPRPLNQPTV